MSPGDRITIQHARHKRRVRIDLNDHTAHQTRLDDGFDRQRLRARSCISRIRCLPHGAVRVPPRVQHGKPAAQYVVRAHLQRRLLRSRSGFRELPRLDADFNCAVSADDEAGGTPNADDAFCVPAEDSLLIKINGCFLDDEDFDGPSYQNDWPGTDPDQGQDAQHHPTPVMFTSPLANGTTKLFECPVRGGLPTDRGCRLAAQPTVLQPDDRAGLRQPAGRRRVLSLSLDADGQRHLHLAGRSAATSRERSTTSAAPRRRRSGRCS